MTPSPPRVTIAGRAMVDGATTHVDTPAVDEADAAHVPAEAPNWMMVWAAVFAGSAVAFALYLYGRLHQGTLETVLFDVGIGDLARAKSWLATVPITFAVAQLLSAMWMWGRLPVGRPAPGWISSAHRWTGTVAFVSSLPVAYHCLWAFGYEPTTTRTLLHGALGMTFYGLFVTKMLLLRVERLPSRALPVIGATVFTTLVVVWSTSALWFFTDGGFPGR